MNLANKVTASVPKSTKSFKVSSSRAESFTSSNAAWN
jgi:hypothetical protein